MIVNVFLSESTLLPMWGLLLTVSDVFALEEFIILLYQMIHDLFLEFVFKKMLNLVEPQYLLRGWT
jgi:hypothetical protein